MNLLSLSQISCLYVGRHVSSSVSLNPVCKLRTVALQQVNNGQAHKTQH